MRYTEVVDEQTQKELERLDAEIAKARKLRRAGGIFLGICALYLCVPMLIGAYGGAWRGDIWDPYTGEPVPRHSEQTVHCFEDARRLIGEAHGAKKLQRSWDKQVGAWRVKCRKDHPELAQLLGETRAGLLELAKKKR